MIFWPQDNKCYQIHTKGPCSKGKLISLDNNGIARCKVGITDGCVEIVNNVSITHYGDTATLLPV